MQSLLDLYRRWQIENDVTQWVKFVPGDNGKTKMLTFDVPADQSQISSETAQSPPSPQPKQPQDL